MKSARQATARLHGPRRLVLHFFDVNIYLVSTTVRIMIPSNTRHLHHCGFGWFETLSCRHLAFFWCQNMPYVNILVTTTSYNSIYHKEQQIHLVVTAKTHTESTVVVLIVVDKTRILVYHKNPNRNEKRKKKKRPLTTDRDEFC